MLNDLKCFSQLYGLSELIESLSFRLIENSINKLKNNFVFN
jgi:hypothetical protein